MKALDTNVLIRFLVQGDVNQADKVIQLFSRAEQNKDVLFVPLLVVLEVIWVLQSAYSVTREDIILAINNLLQMQVLEFESQGVVRNFICCANQYSYDLSDILIAQSAVTANCETTLTFDKKASQFELFTMM